MELTNRRDIRLVGRAMREDWPTTPERKQEAIEALMGVIRMGDPDLSVEAFKALVKADEANMKRRMLDLKQQEMDEQRRARLLEFARNLPAGELAKLASDHGYIVEAGQPAEG